MKKLETPIVPLAYTAFKAAAVLDMSEDSFKKYVAPDLRPIRCGEKTLYAVAGIEHWLAEKAEPSIAQQLH